MIDVGGADALPVAMRDVRLADIKRLIRYREGKRCVGEDYPPISVPIYRRQEMTHVTLATPITGHMVVT